MCEGVETVAEIYQPSLTFCLCEIDKMLISFLILYNVTVLT